MSVEGEKSGAKYVSDEDKKRFEDLFNSLDTNKDGTVDIQELTAALKGRREPSRQAAVSIDYYLSHCYSINMGQIIIVIPPASVCLSVCLSVTSTTVAVFNHFY